MNSDIATWQHGMLALLILLVTSALAYAIFSAARSKLNKRRRILAARVRSGHVPLDIPGSQNADLAPSASREATLTPSEPRRAFVVDEQPTIRILYTDAYGKLADRTIEVEMLDLHRRAIVAKGNSVYDPRIFPLDRIVQARNHRTGKPFDVGQWVEAVRVARRRRETQTDFQGLDATY